MITRRDILSGSGSVLATSLLRGRAARARDRKPNLLYLLAEDHAAYVMGADGSRLARTPNLDRLASEGAQFARNYCNAPVCTASRQSFFTSQLPHAAGVTVLNTALAESKPTLAKQLPGSGYQTAVFGKMHFNVQGRPGLHGFDVACTEDLCQTGWLSQVGPAQPPPGVAVKPAVWRPFREPARVWLDADTLPAARNYEDMEGTWIARRAGQYLREHKDEPFALWCSFKSLHSPFNFPIEDRHRFDPASFDVPQLGPDDWSQIPLIFQDLEARDKQGIIASYYTAVSFLDRNIGEVLQALRALHLEEDTLVIYMADHGYSLGQHGRFEKHTCYEPALRVPLIMRWPGRIGPGKTVSDFTESVDVPPTILELLNAEPFAVNHGRSIVSYLRDGRSATPRQSIFTEYLENEEACIRTQQWKFIYCSGRRLREDGYLAADPLPGRHVRLLDERDDPGEFTDVAAKHPELVGKFTRKLLTKFRTTHLDAPSEPSLPHEAAALDWYLRPRDAAPIPAWNSLGSAQ